MLHYAWDIYQNDQVRSLLSCCFMWYVWFVNVEKHAHWQKYLSYELRLQETLGTISRSGTDSVPPRVMDLLKLFLAASNRGEQAVIFLETRQRTLITKFRSVEKVAGTQAQLTTPSTKKRRNNPARARRSQLRLEEFTKKKLEEQVGSAKCPGWRQRSCWSKQQ